MRVLNACNVWRYNYIQKPQWLLRQKSGSWPTLKRSLWQKCIEFTILWSITTPFRQSGSNFFYGYKKPSSHSVLSWLKQSCFKEFTNYLEHKAFACIIISNKWSVDIIVLNDSVWLTSFGVSDTARFLYIHFLEDTIWTMTVYLACAEAN